MKTTYVVIGVALLALLALVFVGGMGLGVVTAPPAIGAVTIEGNNNTVIGQAGDGNSASVEQARPRRSGNVYEVFFGVGIVLAGFVLVAVTFANGGGVER